MNYAKRAIADERIPRAVSTTFQHTLEIYAGETNKVASVWRAFGDGDLGFRPDPKSSAVIDILNHQLLSERRFFGEFLGAPEPAAADVLPPAGSIGAYVVRLTELAAPRLDFLAGREQAWWLEAVDFFDVRRERVWIFWRRVLHTAHHRTQLTVYLRLLGRPVPPVYGPTADVSWAGADPTRSVDAAGRKS